MVFGWGACGSGSAGSQCGCPGVAGCAVGLKGLIDLIGLVGAVGSELLLGAHPVIEVAPGRPAFVFPDLAGQSRNRFLGDGWFSLCGRSHALVLYVVVPIGVRASASGADRCAMGRGG